MEGYMDIGRYIDIYIQELSLMKNEAGPTGKYLRGKKKSYCSTASIFIPTTHNLSQGCYRLGVFYTPFLSGHLN